MNRIAASGLRSRLLECRKLAGKTQAGLAGSTSPKIPNRYGKVTVESASVYNFSRIAILCVVLGLDTRLKSVESILVALQVVKSAIYGVEIFEAGTRRVPAAVLFVQWNYTNNAACTNRDSRRSIIVF
jgi:hypothetical protein